MNFTTRMAVLLSAMRRERNGAVADAMRYYGTAYGLNYGTSLPTLRGIARAEGHDHDFARYLYLQDVRELRLAALHIAEPERLVIAEADAWAAGIVNSEVAEEAAFALLSPSEALEELFGMWIVSENPLLVYTALLAAARSPLADVGYAETALGALHRFAAAEKSADDQLVAAGHFSDERSVAATDTTEHCANERAILIQTDGSPFVAAYTSAGQSVSGQATHSAPSMTLPAAHCHAWPALSARDGVRLIAKGTVALLAAVGAKNEESRRAVLRMADSPGKLPAEDCVHEELSWRLEA